jgi:hypothetical protein
MSKFETFLSRILHTKNNMSYVPDVSMFPYWTNPLEKEHNEFVEKYDKIVDENDGLQQELEEKVDEAQVIFQENLKYKKEINIIREAVENECQASGIMELMNMRIEEAETKAREQEHLKVIAETNLKTEKECVIRLIGEVSSISDKFSNRGYSCCDECDDWEIHAEMEEIAELEPGAPYSMVCLDCRDNYYGQCDECMEWIKNTEITIQGDREICDNCSNSDNED